MHHLKVRGKPHIFFKNGKWRTMRVDHFLLLVSDYRYFRLNADADLYCKKHNKEIKK